MPAVRRRWFGLPVILSLLSFESFPALRHGLWSGRAGWCQFCWLLAKQLEGDDPWFHFHSRFGSWCASDKSVISGLQW